MLQWPREAINSMIERAILDAEMRGVKVLSLGLLNQASKLTLFSYSLKEKKIKFINAFIISLGVMNNMLYVTSSNIMRPIPCM
jgi:aldehyde decarbonylase